MITLIRNEDYISDTFGTGFFFIIKFDPLPESNTSKREMYIVNAF